MSDTIYTCVNCEVKSTPENRILFATEWECMNCIGKTPESQATEQRNKWLELYSHGGLSLA